MSERQGATAGELLRAARQKQGLHIAALAASIKVTPAKLEALEADRYDELPDATFTRALAQSVCRVLKIDAQPVLAQLPSSLAARLEKVDGGLNTPFRERPGRIDPTDWSVARHPALWLVLLLLAAAAAFVIWPAEGVPRWNGTGSGGAASPPTAASPASVVEVVRAGVVEAASAAVAGVGLASLPAATGPSVPAPPAAPAAPVVVAAAAPAVPAPVASASGPASVARPAPANATRLQAVQATWVQAVDARGQMLLNRTLEVGETVDLDGARPLRLRIGNVKGTLVQHRGQAIDLAARTQNNVANVELP